MTDAEREFLEAIHAAKRYTQTIAADLVAPPLQAAFGQFLGRLEEASRAAEPPVEVSARTAAWARGAAAFRAWRAVPRQAFLIANDA